MMFVVMVGMMVLGEKGGLENCVKRNDLKFCRGGIRVASCINRASVQFKERSVAVAIRMSTARFNAQDKTDLIQKEARATMCRGILPSIVNAKSKPV